MRTAREQFSPRACMPSPFALCYAVFLAFLSSRLYRLPVASLLSLVPFLYSAVSLFCWVCADPHVLFVCFIASQHTLNQLRLQQYTTTVSVSSKLPSPYCLALHKSPIRAGRRSTHTHGLLVAWLRLTLLSYFLTIVPAQGLLVAWLRITLLSYFLTIVPAPCSYVRCAYFR